MEIFLIIVIILLITGYPVIYRMLKCGSIEYVKPKVETDPIIKMDIHDLHKLNSRRYVIFKNTSRKN